MRPYVLLELALSSLAAAQLPIVTQFPVTTQVPASPPPLPPTQTKQLTPRPPSQTPPATGAPPPQNPSTVNYNFETVERADPITALIPIGEYNLLSFANIQWVDTDPDLDGNHLGLAPHTYPDAATFGAGVDSLTGATPVISARYVESTIEGFTPRSWWYGCVLPSPYTAGSLPVGCDITATGYSRAGEAVASQTFPFVANGSMVQDQEFGTFSGAFAGIYDLGFSVTSHNTTIVAAALVDNFIATLTQKSCAAYYEGSYNNGT
ncbi:hypothetical protein Tdes44962_MAKER08199 [Teratosphaeria destructans]|uniref:Uncharacterized protein n=1 Tax=Teratosphaeria destructans TaxID=418781 RepID=A0A9W7SX26_9PEZI|nr:hypothetical protein Tdes44962_MAKER08199 [Teratosphaeria destructans]